MTTATPLPASFSSPDLEGVRLALHWWKTQTLNVVNRRDQLIARIPLNLVKDHHDPSFLLNTIVRACSRPPGDWVDEPLEYALSPPGIDAVLAAGEVIATATDVDGEQVTLNPKQPMLQPEVDPNLTRKAIRNDPTEAAFRALLIARDGECPITGRSHRYTDATNIVPPYAAPVYTRLGLAPYTSRAGLLCGGMLRQSFDEQEICLLRNEDRVDLLVLTAEHGSVTPLHGASFSFQDAWPDAETAPSAAALDKKSNGTLLFRLGAGRKEVFGDVQ